MFALFARIKRRWRNRLSRYRDAGHMDGKRAIPHIDTDELPEALQQLERFGNQEITDAAEHAVKTRTALQSIRKTTVELFVATQKTHGDATMETGLRQQEMRQARATFFAFHRRSPTYSGIRVILLTLLFLGLTVSADYPLNMVAFSELGDNEALTDIMGLIFTIILMMDAHTIGALFRSDNPAAKWTARFLGATSLAFVIVLSLMRKRRSSSLLRRISRNSIRDLSSLST